MYKDLSWENAAYLVWDGASVAAPFLPGSYAGKAVVKGGKKVVKAVANSKAGKAVAKVVKSGAKYVKKGGAKVVKGIKSGWNKTKGAVKKFFKDETGSVAKSSLKRLKNNKEANKVAKIFDYSGAEELKMSFVGKDAVSKFDMMQDTKTKEIVLVKKDNSKIKVHTGLYK